MQLTIALAAALASAICAALSNVLQHRSARSSPAGTGLRIGLVLHLLRRPAWLAGFAAAGAALGFHSLALTAGQLAVVQPVLMTALLFALPASALVEGRRPSAQEWGWAALLVCGLATFLVASQPSGGVSTPPSGRLALALAAAALLAVVVVASSVRARPRVRAALLGLATGIAYGMVAALIKVVLAEATGGLVHVLAGWELWALLGVGASAVVLNQTAFQAGPLAATLPPLTLADPIVSTVLGVVAFGDRLRGAPLDVVVEVLAAVAIAVAVFRLSSRTSVDPPDRTLPAAPTPLERTR